MTTSTDPTQVLVSDAVIVGSSSQSRPFGPTQSVVLDRRNKWTAIALLVTMTVAGVLVAIAIAASWLLIVAVLFVVGLVDRVARKISGKGSK